MDRNSVTHFEDLSNEVIYEVFEYADTYDIYEGFSKLNIRFQNLLKCSSFPLKIDISSLSKSTFERYYTQIIIHNKHRIQSLQLSDPFTVEFFFSMNENISTYSQLQTLSLYYMESEYLENLLNGLASLPKLFSLGVVVGRGPYKQNIYSLIFALPVLKHCKISVPPIVCFRSLPLCTKSPSSIEHLVINGRCDYTEVDAIVSYVPQLRHLSINYVSKFFNSGIRVFSSVLKNLTHVSLTINNVHLDHIEPFIKKSFGHVKVLHISTSNDTTYLDADRWEQLVVSHMPYLHIFDVQYTYEIRYGNKYEEMSEYLLQKLTSPFWFERQWFFTHEECNSEGLGYRIFYSIQPYRRKYFTLTDESNLDKCSYNKTTVLDSVHHVIIPNERVINNCSKYFPNANELTIRYHCSGHSQDSTSDSINRIISLVQLTKLTIDYGHHPFSKVVDLLYLTPNVHTLVFERLSLVATEYFPLQKSEKFRLVSYQNKIKHVTVSSDYSLLNIKLFIILCPKLQQLSLGTSDICLESTIQFLLLETNRTTCHLSSICIFGGNTRNTLWIEKLKTLIQSEELLTDCSIKIIAKNVYLWW